MGRRSCAQAEQCFSASARSCTMRSRFRCRAGGCLPPVFFAAASPVVLQPAPLSSSLSVVSFDSAAAASASGCSACNATANNASWSTESCSLLRPRLASSNSRNRASIFDFAPHSRSSCASRSSTIRCKTFGSLGRCRGSIATDVMVANDALFFKRNTHKTSMFIRLTKLFAHIASAASPDSDRCPTATLLTPVP